MCKTGVFGELQGRQQVREEAEIPIPAPRQAQNQAGILT